MEFRDPFSTAAQTYEQTRAVERDAGLRAYMLRIYNYMASALALTGIVALFAANSPFFLSLLSLHPCTSCVSRFPSPLTMYLSMDLGVPLVA